MNRFVPKCQHKLPDIKFTLCSTEHDRYVLPPSQHLCESGIAPYSDTPTALCGSISNSNPYNLSSSDTHTTACYIVQNLTTDYTPLLPSSSSESTVVPNISHTCQELVGAIVTN